ncbi:Phosphatidylinositol-4-phosphate 5-kinase [Steccherinum ochraceum]|uniref:1-phosphatidylinositol-4-phosphate 5-kinase n=1 Tax=Steccherinum ochraceum TaxID=92696 RepID=A0A4R0RBU9_9APHY|nr:Phosphatidylinositol-4-phosphate 5-kinase [Steccherinum ochraceum]
MAAAAPIVIPRSTSPSSIDDYLQSATSSYLTAPQSAASTSSRPPSTRSSSAHTIGAADGLNPIHALALGAANKSQAQEVHIVKVTDDVVKLQTGPVPDSLLHKVGHSIANAVFDGRGESRMPTSVRDGRSEARQDSGDSAGPPPPSPPASAEFDAGEEVSIPEDQTPKPPLSPSITFEDPIRERQASSSSSSRQFPKGTGRAQPNGHGLIHRSSGDTKSSMRTTSISTINARPNRTSNQSDGTMFSENVMTEEPDGFLHPPPAVPHKTSRRNTISSAGVIPPARPPPNRHLTVQSTTRVFETGIEMEAELGEFAEEMQQQAEQIRRERNSRRQRQQAEAEAQKAHQDAERALTRTASLVRGFSQRDEAKPLVGNLIGEDHVNYVLMYNMLTGIRIAVSRCQAKIRRPLTEDDFGACHKYSFDIIGNELTPSAKYDFKFKDYAPWVFRELREDYFHLDPADYLLSLTAKYILSELGSPGKSGSFFYFSRDYRFIIKTIHHNEHKFLRKILVRYYDHIKSNPHTLLSRFYGLHRVKLPHGRKIHFVIMNNLFPAHKDVHETYDLKGSTVGREYPEDKAAENPRAVLKDLNWINRGKTLELGPEKSALLTEQLSRDSELLKSLHVMDYSLLVGIHSMRRGNRDNVRSNTLKVFSPEVPLTRRKTVKGPKSPDAAAVRRAMRVSNLQPVDHVTFHLPDSDTGERQHFIFYQDEGGLRATDEANESLDTIYYLGVIDILTPYTTLKKLEHFWKGMQADRHKISPVPPTEYADRFFAFMRAVIRGGEGGGRFKSE